LCPTNGLYGRLFDRQEIYERDIERTTDAFTP
jgi:hypothetical protein